MDDFLSLRPTLLSATMTPEEAVAVGSSPLALFLTTPPPEEGNMSTSFTNSVVCDDQVLNVDVSEYDYPYRLETWVPITWREILKIIAYVVIFLVSLTGNLLVLLVVYYNAHMRTSTNQYLVNLAAADLLVTLVCMWVHIVRHLSHPNYILPVLFCKLESFVQATSLLASVLTLTVISVGRFVAVMFPLRARTSPDRAHRVIAAVWMTSALLASPTLLYRQYYSIQWANYTSWQCDEIWPSVDQYDPKLGHCVKLYDTKTLFYTVFTIALYFLPVGIMLINYSMVVWRLWMTQMPGEHNAPARQTATKAKKKVVKMVSVVLLVFVLCWTPLQSIILYSNFVHLQHNSLPVWFPSMEFAAYCIAFSNSALNPIIYCGFNVNFRQGFVALLTCRQSRTSGRIYHPRSTLKTSLPPERRESTGNWRGRTGGTKESTLGSSGPEPAILLEFNALKKNKFGQGKCRSVMSVDVQNSLSDSGSDSIYKKSAQEGTIGETQLNSSNHQQQPTTHRTSDSSTGPKGLQALQALSRRGIGPSALRRFQETPLPSFDHKGLVGCCCGKRNGRLKEQLVANERQQMYAMSEVRDNVSNDTKEDML